jgi:hypothetical protein
MFPACYPRRLFPELASRAKSQVSAGEGMWQVGELLLSRAIQLPPVHASDAELGPDLLPAHPLFRRWRALVSVGLDAS